MQSPSRYKIRVRGRVELAWSELLGGMEVLAESSEGGPIVTELRGSLSDQAALMGVLETLHDLGLQLLSVERASDRVRVEPE